MNITKEIIDDYILSIRSFIDNMISMEQYSLKLVQEDSLHFTRLLKDVEKEVVMINRVISFLHEKEKDSPDERLLEYLEEFIKNDKMANFFYENIYSENSSYKSDVEYVRLAIHKSNKENEIIKRQRKQVINSYLLNLATSFEMLVNNLYKFYLLNIYQDESLFYEKKLSFKEISFIESKEEIKAHYVDKYMEDIFRGNVRSWTEEFVKNCTRENKQKVEKDYGDTFDLLTETFERRNIIVHNNGIVNLKYQNNISKKLSNELSLGSEIDTNILYLEERISLLLNFGVKLIMWNFKKGQLKDNVEIVDQLNSLGIYLLNNNKFESARTIFKTIMDVSNVSNNIILFNYWLSYKLNDELELVIDEIEDYKNNNNLNNQDEFACSLLIESKEKAIDTTIDFINSLDEIYNLDKDEIIFIKINILDEWPILNPIRKEDKFIEFMESVFYNKDVLKEAIDMKPLDSQEVKEVKDTINKEK